MTTMKREILKKWFQLRLERKIRMEEGVGYVSTVAEVLQHAGWDVREYEQIAGKPYFRDHDVDEIVDEMRRSVTGSWLGLEEEGTRIVNDAGNILTGAERDYLQRRLNDMADECERRIRDTMQSLFDRIGPPEANNLFSSMSDRRARIRKATRPAPGAHDRYR
jgi:hypothetical protein